MGPDVIMDLFRQALVILITMVGIIVLPSLAAGLVISIFQAATQINEQSLSFIPRLIIIFLTLMFLGPWLASYIHDFTIRIFETIPLVLV
tara:strand:+ start:102874 stop:103143 length:270 start_codon:yes stop_codon:yes gene_type:complete